ncbi:GIY-YIG nuclease family protein [Acidithiobacillus caldus]|jgi:hypothetical protein|uniref:Bacteriophage T5 Orf172 DNA-binding domain-containing protein n=2 Tax=Acidithiobacillus caldus TaxID=33059 RepID=F9ZLB4_ACICS|nr:GIY-YIG nuclease family protein [Acidithiobacillus caldus]AEK57783.1 conserved hypothetical protein [Acidithiobacillus caldus SM-1]AUW32468.1 GIY-YIG nuclease family protein [Acidithiobacillus caldus]MBU2782452.1 GIY-YIG nuclease family protein [Acidithiobacillus caldus]MBU2790626.1 GIY-YIG nuclease family protein [Acidithiobacillus caldus]MBU2821054.1 GIY-YIG nuclease family protein [Acidithiobacillus caldus]
MSDIIYVLTNEAMPGLVKIGRTTDDVTGRIAALNSATGVPLPFECYFAAEVEDACRLEKQLHQLFSEYRINPKREFFRVEAEKVVLAIGIGPFRRVDVAEPVLDAEDKGALERAKQRRPNLRLEALGIPVGAELVFTRDPQQTAKVLPGNRVEFRGQSMSLSAAALAALHDLGYTTPTAQGSVYWSYQGELLDEIRQRLEAAQFGETGGEA